MGRHKRSELEAWIELLARWPWWVSVGLGVAAFALLHWLAQPPVVDGRSTATLIASAPRAIRAEVAGWLQYLVPLMFGVSAALSARRAKARRDWQSRAIDLQGAAITHGLTWQEFERLVGAGFREQGYDVEETGASGPDGGVDLRLSLRTDTGRETFLAQCKHWRAQRVGVQVIRELYGVMAAEGATGGFVITSGDFTADALRFAGGRNIQLVNGEALRAMLTRGRLASSRALADSPSSATTDRAPTSPLCPRCAQSMVWRTARRGRHAGQSFWGCSAFPACRGTVSVSDAAPRGARDAAS